MVGPQEQFTIGMDLMNMRKSLKESRAKIIIPKSSNLIMRELIIAEEARDNVLPLSGEIKLLLKAFGSRDDIPSGGSASGERLGNSVTATGKSIHLHLNPIQGVLSHGGGFEEVLVDGEGTLLNGGSKVAAGLRGVVGVEGRECVEGRQ